MVPVLTPLRRLRGAAAIARACAAPLVALLAASAAAAQTATIWHHTYTSPVGYAGVLANGYLGVLTDSGLSVLAPDDGQELWRAPKACCFRGSELSNLMVVLGRHPGRVVEIDHGRIQWEFHGLALDSMRGFAAIPERNLLLVYGIGADRAFRLVAASLDSGIVRWRDDTLFSQVPDLPRNWKELSVTESQPLLLDSDTTLVLFPSRGGVMRLDTRTGALLWRADSLARVDAPVAPWGYAHLVLDSSVVLVPFERRLAAVRISDGRIAWTTAQEFPSRLAQIEVTPHGYVVRGYFKGGKPSVAVKPFVDLLDPATGRSRWPRPVRDLDDGSAMVVQGDTAWVASQRRLTAVALPGGETHERARFEFKGDELPAGIEAQDGGFVLVSEHNLVSVTPAGEVRYQRYYSRPGSSLFSKLLDATLLIGMSAAATATNTYLVPRPEPKPVADPRYARALKAQQYVHILTGAKDTTGAKGFSVVRLDKTTGQEVGRVWVNGRSPDYVIDGATGILYLVREKTTIEALQF